MDTPLFVVTAVDHGETCDGKARVLFLTPDEKIAREFVKNDISCWVDQRADEGVECDFDKMRAYYDYDTDDGCEWNIEKVMVG